MRRRNDSASIFTVGCALTKAKMKREAKSMMPKESTTAEMMTIMLLVIPTAVMTESREKTRSSSRIWTRTLPKVAVATFSPGP